jgi:hypothetical protein
VCTRSLLPGKDLGRFLSVLRKKETLAFARQ